MKNYLWYMFVNIKNVRLANKSPFIIQTRRRICEEFLKALWRKGIWVGYTINRLNNSKKIQVKIRVKCPRREASYYVFSKHPVKPRGGKKNLAYLLKQVRKNNPTIKPLVLHNNWKGKTYWGRFYKVPVRRLARFKSLN